jgi:hypothetical protein
MVYRLCVRHASLFWVGLSQNPKDHEIFSNLCHVGIHMSFATIETPLGLQALM